MNTKEIWNLIVEQYNQRFKDEEKNIQELWERYCTELLGYRTIFNEIDSQRKIFLGSKERVIPDIVLRKNNKDIATIELKRYMFEFDKNFETQLISYLKQLQLSIGIIICKKIYIYVYNYLNNDYKKLSIEFIKDSEMGQKFIEMFSKDSFDKTKIEDYINLKNKTEENIEDIKKQIDKNLVIDCLKNYFCEQYTIDETEKAISCFNINIFIKNEEKPKCLKCNLNYVEYSGDICDYCKNIGSVKSNSKDYTQYNFNGKQYGKNRLVLAVVKDYVNKHPHITYSELKSVFPNELQGTTKGVMVNEQTFKSNPDNKKRYFVKYEEVIQLDEKVYVCTQWGYFNIGKFIKKARQLGYEITEMTN